MVQHLLIIKLCCSMTVGYRYPISKLYFVVDRILQLGYQYRTSFICRIVWYNYNPYSPNCTYREVIALIVVSPINITDIYELVYIV